MTTPELLKLAISEIAPKIRAKEVSPVEVTEAALAQADRLQPSLNSFITLMHDQAMSQARDAEAAIARGEYLGPLHGVPIGIKDNLATAGVLITLGTKVLADYVPDEDAHVVTLCKQAGAIILGKENMEEFASGAASNNPHYGPVHNPWNLDHVPGGSSGGGGANAAACVTFASLGTDLGGSVRMPGSFCGVVGLKQTFGRVSQRGLLGTTFNGDHIGPMTRTTRDCALLLQIIAGYDSLDPSTVPVPVADYTANLENDLQGLKMGIPTDHYFDIMDSEVEAAVRQAIEALKGLGAELIEVSLPSMRYAGAIRAVAAADSIVAHEPYIRSNRQDYSADTLYRALAGQFVLARDYSKALKAQRIIKEEYLRVLQQVDFLATPTTPVAAPRIDPPTFTLVGEQHPLKGPGSGSVSRNTSPSNATGLPAISIPCGLTQEQRLPIGLQLIGRPFDEALLFQVAHSYEAVSPSRGLRPPIVDA